MDKSEYHLLYVLSQPPIPVAPKRAHGWRAGDVLLAENNPALQSTDTFLVLDVGEQRRAMALKISEMPASPQRLGQYFDVESSESDLSEPGVKLGISNAQYR
jgi:hypothetical protein